MILKPKRGLFILISLLFLSGQPATAAQSDPVLKVGISPFSPFVILAEGKKPIGLSIDLWQALSRTLETDFEYVVCGGVAEKLKRLEEGRIDLAIGGITINENRESKFDFSHPVFHTGLDILIPSTEEITFFGLLSSLITGKKLVFVGALLILVVIAGNIIWIVERSTTRRATGFNKNYIPGVFQGMYWALITATTIGYGDKVPQRWTGRILAAVIIIIFLPLFGFFIAELSSDLTLKSLKSNINGIEDLWGRKVAVVNGTTSHEYMQRMHAYLYAFDRVEDSIAALEQGDVDAFVYDAPNLLYYTNGEGKGKVTVVGKIFEPQDYGLALPQGSPLREKVNRAILKLAGLDELEDIQRKWFGTSSRG